MADTFNTSPNHSVPTDHACQPIQRSAGSMGTPGAISGIIHLITDMDYDGVNAESKNNGGGGSVGFPPYHHSAKVLWRGNRN